jgi:4-amino-4-deoxy-L-arabinose transferase-like glycosyltransferase
MDRDPGSDNQPAGHLIGFVSRFDRRTAWIGVALTGVTAIAAALRFWGLHFGLPNTLARPDEETITSVATHILHAGPNPRFFRYPTLYIYVVALIDRIRFGAGGPSDASSAFLISRTITAVAGTATVPLLFAAARRRFSDTTAVIAAVLLAVAFLHVRGSHFGVTDVPAAFMAMLAFYATLRLPLTADRWWNIAFAGWLCGLAAATKYNVALVVFPLVIATIQQNAGVTGWRRPLLCGAAILVGAGVGFALGTPYAFIDQRRFERDFIAERTHLLAGHVGLAGFGWTRHLSVSLRYGLGPLFLAASVAGAVALMATDVETAVLVLSFPMIYYAAIGAGRTAFSRYMLPIVPFLALLAAIAIERSAAAAMKIAKNRRAVYACAAIVLTAAVAYRSAERSLRFDRVLKQTDSRVLAARWIRSHFPVEMTIYQTGAIYGHAQLDDGRQEQQFDERAGMFLLGGVPTSAMPRVVVVQTSPLVAYSQVPETLRPLLMKDYHLVQSFEVENRRVPIEPVFGQEDAFFVPLGGIERYIRPGPRIDIFELRKP